jgi:hypothetical protein
MAIVEEGQEERGYARAVAIGTIIGIPVVFLIVMVIALPLGWPEAAGVAAVPAFFGGPLFGGFAMVLALVARWEREERAGHTPPVSVEEPRAAA